MPALGTKRLWWTHGRPPYLCSHGRNVRPKPEQTCSIEEGIWGVNPPCYGHFERVGTAGSFFSGSIDPFGRIIGRMAVETIIPPAASELQKPKRERRIRVRRPTWPGWLARVLLESFFIMLSILLALAVDNWSEGRRHQRLAQQSLQIFDRELRQNMAVVESNAPYHKGLRGVVAEAVANPTAAADMRSIVEGLKAARLRNTAWETALASGALTHIDVETISGLSLTYSFQERFRQLSMAASERVSLISESDGDLSARTVRDIYAYLNELVEAEEELIVHYKLALERIGAQLLLTSPDSLATSPDSVTTSP